MTFFIQSETIEELSRTRYSVISAYKVSSSERL